MARLDGIEATLRTQGGLIVNRLVDGLQQNEQSASGNLEESITFEVGQESGRVTLDILLADYYKFVDMGRGPGKPPPRIQILKWLSYPNVRDRLQLSKGWLDKEMYTMAYFIQRKIAKEGTKGNHFFTNVIEKSGIIDETVEAIADAAVNDLSLAIDKLKLTVETRSR